MRRSFLKTPLFVAVISFVSAIGLAQSAPPVADSYTQSSKSSTNFGTQTSLLVASGTTSYLQFDLSTLPAGTTVSKATLRLYVNTVTTAGSFDVDQVGASWSEKALTYKNEPPLGPSATGLHPIAVTSSTLNQFVIIDITSLVQDWVSEPGVFPNYGVALVLQGNTGSIAFDSKESTATSHQPELEIAMSGPIGPQGPQGPQGLNGGAGLTGPAGPAGPTGVAGPQGPNGAAGSTGPAGPAGPTGVAGPTGGTGAQGLTGPPGSIGLSGPVGPPGPTGLQGTQGPAGASGTFGAGVNAQTADYVTGAGDNGKLITMSGGSLTVTLPSPALSSPWYVGVQNLNGSNLTILSSAQINGSAGSGLTVPPQQIVQVWTDGTNYFASPTLLAGSNITLSPTSNGLVISGASGGGPGGTAGGDLTGTYPNPTLVPVGAVGTYTKVTTDGQGRVVSGTNLTAADVPNLAPSYVQNQTGTPQAAGFNISGNGSMGGSLGVAGTVTGSSIRSTAPIGTPPLVVSSTTQVPNLNASQVGGKAITGSGAALTTGPAVSTSNNIAVFTGASGQLADSGVPLTIASAATNVIVASGLTPGFVYATGPSGLVPAVMSASATNPALCFATSATQCQLSGYVNASGLTAGAIYYVSTTSAGALSSTRPSASGTCIQVFGQALSSTVLILTPSPDYGCIQ